MKAEFGTQLSSVFSKIMDKNDYNLKSRRHASEIRYVDYQCTRRATGQDAATLSH